MTGSGDSAERVKADWRWEQGASDYWLNPHEPAPGWQAEKYAGMVQVTRDGWTGQDGLGAFIDGLRRVAEGLTDPVILLISDMPGEHPYVYVQGWRPITPHDRERLDAVAAHVAERERQEYEALREKFGDGASGEAG